MQQVEFGLTDRKAVNFLLDEDGEGSAPAARQFAEDPEQWCQLVRVKYDNESLVLESTVTAEATPPESIRAVEVLAQAVPELEAAAYDQLHADAVIHYQETYEAWEAAGRTSDALNPVISAALTLRSGCPVGFQGW